MPEKNKTDLKELHSKLTGDTELQDLHSRLTKPLEKGPPKGPLDQELQDLHSRLTGVEEGTPQEGFVQMLSEAGSGGVSRSIQKRMLRPGEELPSEELPSKEEEEESRPLVDRQALLTTAAKSLLFLTKAGKVTAEALGAYRFEKPPSAPELEEEEEEEEPDRERIYADTAKSLLFVNKTGGLKWMREYDEFQDPLLTGELEIPENLTASSYDEREEIRGALVNQGWTREEAEKIFDEMMKLRPGFIEREVKLPWGPADYARETLLSVKWRDVKTAAFTIPSLVMSMGRGAAQTAVTAGAAVRGASTREREPRTWEEGAREAAAALREGRPLTSEGARTESEVLLNTLDRVLGWWGVPRSVQEAKGLFAEGREEYQEYRQEQRELGPAAEMGLVGAPGRPQLEGLANLGVRTPSEEIFERGAEEALQEMEQRGDYDLAALYSLAHGISQTSLSMLAMNALGASLIPGVYARAGPELKKLGLMPVFIRLLKNAIRTATIYSATRPDITPYERLKLGTKMIAFLMTPIIARVMPNNVSAIMTDFGLNMSLSTVLEGFAGPGSIDTARAMVKKIGGDPEDFWQVAWMLLRQKGGVVASNFLSSIGTRAGAEWTKFPGDAKRYMRAEVARVEKTMDKVQVEDLKDSIKGMQELQRVADMTRTVRGDEGAVEDIMFTLMKYSSQHKDFSFEEGARLWGLERVDDPTPVRAVKYPELRFTDPIREAEKAIAEQGANITPIDRLDMRERATLEARRRFGELAQKLADEMGIYELMDEHGIPRENLTMSLVELPSSSSAPIGGFVWPRGGAEHWAEDPIHLGVQVNRGRMLPPEVGHWEGPRRHPYEEWSPKAERVKQPIPPGEEPDLSALSPPPPFRGGPGPTVPLRSVAYASEAVAREALLHELTHIRDALLAYRHTDQYTAWARMGGNDPRFFSEGEHFNNFLREVWLLQRDLLYSHKQPSFYRFAEPPKRPPSRKLPPSVRKYIQQETPLAISDFRGYEGSGKKGAVTIADVEELVARRREIWTKPVRPRPDVVQHSQDMGMSWWENWLTDLENRFLSRVAPGMKMPFTQTGATESALREMRAWRYQKSAELTELIDMMNDKKATAEERVLMDTVLSGEKGLDALPKHLRPVARDGRQRVIALSQEIARKLSAMGVDMRKPEDFRYSEHYYPRLYKQYNKQFMSIGERLYHGFKKFQLTRAEREHLGNPRASDNFAVWVRAKTGKHWNVDSVHKERGPAEARQRVVEKEQPGAKTVVSEPKPRELLVAEGLINDLSYNLSKGFGREIREAGILSIYDKLGSLGPDLVKAPSDVQPRGFTNLRDGPHRVAPPPKRVLDKNPNIRKLFEGWVRNDLARDLAAFYGRGGLWDKVTNAVLKIDRPARAATTYLNPPRYPKQIIENEFALAFTNSRAFFSPNLRAYLAQSMGKLIRGQPMEGKYWKELVELGVPLETHGGWIVSGGAEGPRTGLHRAAAHTIKQKVHAGLEYAKQKYGTLDLSYKYALYRYLREQGLSITDAHRQMEGSLFNFRDVPPWIRQLRMIPFKPAVFYNFARILNHQVKTKPIRTMLKAGMLASGWHFLRERQLRALNISDEDLKRMAAAGRKLSWFSLPLWRNEKGQIISVNLDWLMPFAEASSLIPSNFTDLAKPLISILPISLRGAIAGAVGRDRWGNKIRTEATAEKDLWMRYAKETLRSATPQLLGDYWLRLYERSKKPAKTKRDPHVFWYLGPLLGARVHDPAEAWKWMQLDMKGKRNEVEREFYALKKQLEAGYISPETYRSEVKRLRALLEDLHEQQRETGANLPFYAVPE